MERVAFLVEETNQRISCMLNPESLTLRRQTGVSLHSHAAPAISASRDISQTALSSGGGHTEMDLDLVFDVSLSLGSSIVSRDVRDYTRPIWALSEPRDMQLSDPARLERQPYVRFVWGKAWNTLALVLDLAERLEAFDSMGRPGRSWVRMRLLVVATADDEGSDLMQHARAAARKVNIDQEPALGAGRRMHIAAQAAHDGAVVSSDRLDILAERYFKNPNLWRLIAKANDMSRPDRIAPGQRIVIPEPPQGT